MMDFYAFLPSNASPDVYPDNKTSSFKIELSKRMELHGHWQAALIEFHYPNTIGHILAGENEITIKTKYMVDIVFVPPGCYRSAGDFIKAVNDAMKTFEGTDRNYIEETEDHRLVFQPYKTGEESLLSFSPRLALQLGLPGPGPYPFDEPLHALKPVEIKLGIPSQMYLYLDILSDQIIGHTRAPLLRTVPVDIDAKYGSMSIFHCEHPLYFDLNTRSFDTLQIDIRDHAGRLVPFDFGTSTLLVHFKQL